MCGWHVGTTSPFAGMMDFFVALRPHENRENHSLVVEEETRRECRPLRFFAISPIARDLEESRLIRSINLVNLYVPSFTYVVNNN